MCVLHSNRSFGLNDHQNDEKKNLFSLNRRLPYNWRTPLGYLVTLIIQTVASLSCILSIVPAICLLVGLCWLIISFVEDVTNDLNALNIGQNTERSRRIMKERFCSIIQLHMELKQLSIAIRMDADSFIKLTRKGKRWLTFFVFFRFSDDFNGIFEFIILGFFLWTILSIYNTLFIFFALLVEYSECYIDHELTFLTIFHFFCSFFS